MSGDRNAAALLRAAGHPNGRLSGKLKLSAVSRLQRWLLPAALIWAVAGPIVQVAAAQPEGSGISVADRAAIETAYNDMTSAFAADKLCRAGALMTDDYRQIDDRGRGVDKAGAIKEFQAKRNMVRSFQSRLSITSVIAQADGVHVEMATHSWGTGVERILFFSVKGPYTYDLRVKDVWVKTPQGWRLKFRQKLQDEISAG